MADGPQAWRIFSASVEGSSHLARGVGCDDFHTKIELSSGGWVAAVSDGAGSARYAAEGARVAAMQAVRFLLSAVESPSRPFDAETWRIALEGSLRQAHQALADLVRERVGMESDSELSEFAATLLIVCVTNDWFAAAQIGDGGIVIRHMDSSYKLALAPTRGEFINEAHFITASDYLDHAQFRVAPVTEIDAVAVFTDGVELLAVDYATESPHAPFFDVMFGFATSGNATHTMLDDFLRSERVCERTDDDKTLLLAVRLE